MAKQLTEAQQRQVNYTRLRYNGFTKKEATDLVSTKRTLPSGRVIKVALLDLKTPFIRTMIKSRARAWERAKVRGISRVQFEKNIKARLNKGIWVSHQNGNRVFHKINNIWDLIRAYEDRYTDKHPEYYKEKREKRPVTNDDIRGRKPKRISAEQSRQQDIEFVKSEIQRAERMIKQELDPIKKLTLRQSLAQYRNRSSKRLGVDF